jgi:hypothetical protein
LQHRSKRDDREGRRKRDFPLVSPAADHDRRDTGGGSVGHLEARYRVAVRARKGFQNRPDRRSQCRQRQYAGRPLGPARAAQSRRHNIVFVDDNSIAIANVRVLVCGAGAIRIKYPDGPGCD